MSKSLSELDDELVSSNHLVGKKEEAMSVRDCPLYVFEKAKQVCGCKPGKPMEANTYN